jgi:16S rRNA (cytosine1402-N4)-methyltransferase
MRLDPSSSLTAADLVASLSEQELARLIGEYGEDPAGGRIARKLVQARKSKPITSTSQLADLVRAAAGYSSPSRTDPATRTFQALRIAVNDELGNLDSLLAGVRDAALKVRRGDRSWLRSGARVAVISFHSLEDRRAKSCFRSLEAEGLAELLTTGPVVAGEDEQRRNPRSRSAKLRAVRILGRDAV